MKAVVLLSGGIDSTIALYLAKSLGYEVYALSFDYGQKHSRELGCAKASAAKVGVAAHHIVDLKLSNVGGQLTDRPDA
jgi:7-cyano-7-deazaguanine synthase